MVKLTFNEALEIVNGERRVDASKVQARALRRKIWVAEWHLPGCLSESRGYCLTKEEAIATACVMAEGEDGPPRGMKEALRKHGRFDSQSPMFGRCINTVEQHTLRDLL